VSTEPTQAPPPAVLLPPLFLRAAQASAFCAVSEATWWRWDAAGKMPRGRKVSGGVKVWSRPELEAWAAAGCPTRREWEARQAAQHNGRPGWPAAGR
jgi:predicted DNA-binding transcriptional regulator AlpA